MITRLILSLSLCVCLLGFWHVAAAEEVIINQQIGFDANPPTVPGSVVTSPVATTQIDLSWATSTDVDSAVNGYQVFRDNIQIATTSSSNTSYSDIGLTPSTTYSYNVASFDIFFNYSARSATSSTTTLPVVATTTPAASSGGDGEQTELDEVVLEINEVEIEVSENSAEILFMTTGFSVASLVYGQSLQYETGSLAVDTYRKRHRFPIEDLDQGVRYYFKVTAENQRGDQVEYEGEFVTRLADDRVPLANVSNFRAYMEGEHSKLEWVNPSAADFDRVRLIANGSFYPIDQADGYLLYEGKLEDFTHEYVRQQFDVVYYTVFSIDEAGNVSSGAIAHVVINGTVTFLEPAAAEDPASTPATSTPPTSDQVSVTSLSFGGIEFVQDARIHTGYQGLVSLDPGAAFTIRIAYEALPEHLKTITATFVSPKDDSLTYSYLLRANEGKTYYQATIDALGEKSLYPLQISVLDYKMVTLKTIIGNVSTVPKTDQTYAEPTRTFSQQLLFAFVSYWWIWLLILLLVFLLLRRSREEQEAA